MRETFMLGIEDLPTLAERVIGILDGDGKDRASVVLLEGDLGAGKTTFTKALAEHLGIEGEHVHSPTFILKKEYKAKHKNLKKLVHVDAYRFVHPDEAKVLRLEDDMRDPSTLLVVEWPSKMHHLKSDMEIEFDVVDENTREITLTYEERR